jgi:hypothetical protein
MKSKDPYEKNIIKKCDVCERVVLIDQYGNGECGHCGWIQNNDEAEFEKKLKISYPNLVPLSRAREQYKKGLPFKATFEDFVNGLFFYSEMLFDYQNKRHEVFLKDDDIYFESKEFQQIYKTRKEFMEKAHIDGKPLKDIWKDVENAGFMYCE